MTRWPCLNPRCDATLPVVGVCVECANSDYDAGGGNIDLSGPYPER